MPTDHQCFSCGICFSVGWFHYHVFDTYCAETYLVCAECGTWHSVQHACNPVTTQDCLLAHSGPLFRPLNPERIILHKKNKATNERWLADQDQRNRKTMRWKKLLVRPIRLNLMPDTRAMKLWQKMKSGLEIVGYILVSPVLLVCVTLIWVFALFGRSRTSTLDPDRDWVYLSPPTQVVVPGIERVSPEVGASDTIKLNGIRDTFHHLACTHCGVQGALVETWQRKTCPHCKQEQLEMCGDWIT
jgi:hypothetical protein